MRGRVIALVLLVGTSAAPSAIGEVAQQEGVRVSFSGGLAPRDLPRKGSAPIAVWLAGRILTTAGSEPRRLRRIEIAVNRAGHFDTHAVPVCRLKDIRFASTTRARRICGASRIGEGSFEAAVAPSTASPLPARGTVSAFNGLKAGRPVILLHIYGTRPRPTAFALALSMRHERGRFGTVLYGSLPTGGEEAALVKRISLRLGDKPETGARPYLSAGCPAPKGFSQAVFPLARAGFTFAGGESFTATIVRTCRPRERG